MRQYTIRVSDEIGEWLEAAAQQEERPVASLIREAVKALQTERDREREIIAAHEASERCHHTWIAGSPNCLRCGIRRPQTLTTEPKVEFLP